MDAAPVTLGALAREARHRIAPASATPRLDAEVLLEHALGVRRTQILAYPERVLDAPGVARARALVARRAAGEPVAYLVGAREFWSLDLEVGPGVLVPRPETETLVEAALELLPRSGAPRVIDLGTGTGAVALAIASERPDCTVLASDRSRDAIATAARNARRHGLAVGLVRGDWCAPLAAAAFSLVTCNPPYVASGDPALASAPLRFEPRAALAAGPDGGDDLRRIVAQARTRLVAGGWLAVEHGAGQGALVRGLFEAHGYREVATRRDVAGHERVSLARRPR